MPTPVDHHARPRRRRGARAESRDRSDERAQILTATRNVIGIGGFDAATVAKVMATAGMSKRSFYRYFHSLQDAYLAAYDESITELTRAISAPFADPDRSTARSLGIALSILAYRLAADPMVAETVIVGVHAAGPQATARHSQTMRHLHTAIDAVARHAQGDPPPTAITIDAIIGGLHYVIFSRILNGRLHELVEIAPDLIYALTVPYLGHDAAAAARDAARTIPTDDLTH